MENRHLKSFLAIVETKNFNRAAQKLHISQPGLTAQIQRLEEDLQVRLFHRGHKRIQLTDAGTLLVDEAREIIAHVTATKHQLQRVANGELDTLRVGFVSSVSLEIVPQLVRRFTDNHPDIKLHLKQCDTTSQVKALATGELDIGFIRVPAELQQLQCVTVHTESFVAVLSESHPLARRSQLSVQDLASETFVASQRQSAPGYFDSVIALCSRAGFVPTMIKEAPDMRAAVMLAAAGEGVAILPASVAAVYGGRVSVKNLPSSAGTSEVAVAMKPGTSLEAAHTFFKMATSLRTAA